MSANYDSTVKSLHIDVILVACCPIHVKNKLANLQVSLYLYHQNAKHEFQTILFLLSLRETDVDNLLQ